MRSQTVTPLEIGSNWLWYSWLQLTTKTIWHQPTFSTTISHLHVNFHYAKRLSVNFQLWQMMILILYEVCFEVFITWLGYGGLAVFLPGFAMSWSQNQVTRQPLIHDMSNMWISIFERKKKLQSHIFHNATPHINQTDMILKVLREMHNHMLLVIYLADWHAICLLWEALHMSDHIQGPISYTNFPS